VNILSKVTIFFVTISLYMLPVFVKEVHAATYYVSTSGFDSNPGTLESSWQTLKNSLGKLRAGDTLNLRGGTYYEGNITTSSDGHTYKSGYTSTGSFPFNGQGSYDRSKVNLRGTYTLTEVDGNPVSESYCADLNGNLKTTGGRVTVKAYTDTSCQTLESKQTYTVTSYNEDTQGNFTVVATGSGGVVFTTSGVHEFSQ